MAGDTSKGKRPQVPKIFSQKAQQAAVMAQANLDLLKAQTDAAFAQRKANLKVTQERLKFRGQQLDMAAQARADAAAAQQQDAAENPVGPEIEAMPYPDATSPSSSLAGTGNLGAILAANPGGVQGGAAVQQATGGTGTAEPSGVNPAALQSQVAPFNVSQNTVNRTVPIQYPGFVAQVPQSVTETQITPNQLTPFQLGKLLQTQQDQRALQIKEQLAQEGDLAKSLATTQIGVLNGSLPPEMWKQSVMAVASTLEGMGIPQSRIGAIVDRANALAPQLKTEFEGTHDSEFMKTVRYRDSFPTGSPQWREAQDKINQLTGKDSLSESQRRYYDMLSRGPVIESLQQNQRQQQFISIADKMISTLQEKPGLGGAAGTVTGAVTGAVGTGKSLLQDLLPVQDQQALVKDATQIIPDVVRASIGVDGKMDAESAGLINQLQRDIYDPEGVGTMRQLEAALRILYAGAVFKTLNVRAVETLARQRINVTGWGDARTAIAELRTIRNEIDNARAGTEELLGRMKIAPLGNSAPPPTPVPSSPGVYDLPSPRGR